MVCRRKFKDRICRASHLLFLCYCWLFSKKRHLRMTESRDGRSGQVLRHQIIGAKLSWFIGELTFRTQKLDLLGLMLFLLGSKRILFTCGLLLRLKTDRLLFQVSLQFLILQSVFQKRRLLRLYFFPEIIFLIHRAFFSMICLLNLLNLH